MAFKRLAPEVGKQRYWNPTTVGEVIEGNICGNEKDSWNNDRIVLDRGTDEEGNVIKTTLPSHYGLRKYYEKINTGDYIRVTLVDIKEKDDNKLKIYSVEVDDERFKDYGV